jgi:hypothetical protein
MARQLFPSEPLGIVNEKVNWTMIMARHFLPLGWQRHQYEAQRITMDKKGRGMVDEVFSTFAGHQHGCISRTGRQNMQFNGRLG